MPIWFVVFVCIPLAAFRGVGDRKVYVGAALAALLLGVIAVYMTPSQLAYDMLAMATAADPSAGRSRLRTPALLLRYGLPVARSLFAICVASVVGAIVYRAPKAVFDSQLSFPMRGDVEPEPLEPAAGAVQDADYVLMSGHEAPEPDALEEPAVRGNASAIPGAGTMDYPLMSGAESSPDEPDAPPARSGTSAALAEDDVTYALMVGGQAEPAEPRAPAALSGTAAGLQFADATYALMVGEKPEPAKARTPAALSDTGAVPPAADATYALMVGVPAEPAEPIAPVAFSGTGAGPPAVGVAYALMVGEAAGAIEADAPDARNDTATAPGAAGLTFPLVIGTSGTPDPDEPVSRWKGLWSRRRWAVPDD